MLSVRSRRSRDRVPSNTHIGSPESLEARGSKYLDTPIQWIKGFSTLVLLCLAESYIHQPSNTFRHVEGASVATCGDSFKGANLRTRVLRSATCKLPSSYDLPPVATLTRV